MNDKANILCSTCMHHDEVGKVDICTVTAPVWEVKDNVFICHDYVKIKEEKDDEKKKL